MKTDLYFDIFDQATMLYYEELRLDYFEGFLQVTKDLINGEVHSRLSEQAERKLKDLYGILESEDFSKEEVRLAIELLLTKAFKDADLSIGMMTPDTINYLMATIISELFPDQNLRILDTALGTGNLLYCISNHLSEEAELIGIERQERLVKVAEAAAELMNNEITIYFQDALQAIYDVVDVMVGDLDAYEVTVPLNSPLYQRGVRYFPYLLLEERVKNIREGGYFVLVVENDFLTKSKDLYENLEGITLLGMVVLPKSMFQKGYIGKSIIIGTKARRKNHDLMVLEIPDFSKENLRISISKLKFMIKKISEEK
ncbi:MAG: hypothetical protein GX661_02620 [Acholeplasmataceae bacterium]|nr:hypothetical protein [Acholeplasmataceae bacterium]